MGQRWVPECDDPNALHPFECMHQWDPDTSTPPMWTDYLGPQPYVDYTVDWDPNETPEAFEETRYLAGLGIHGQQDMTDPNAPGYYNHGDQILSTMLTVDHDGTDEYALAYTAFGQPVLPDGAGGWTIGWPPAPGDVPTRYQYAGGWGYESGPWGEEVGGVSSDGGLVLYGANTDLPPITLLHVGERWYQPDIGRFVQRDPIGLKGGLNVYAYVENDPLASSDSSGLGNFGSLEAWATYRGLRESGKSAEQASEIMRNSAKDEVVIAGAWCVVGYAGLLAGTLVGPLLPVGAAKAAETYELIIVRTTPGADGAISMIVKTIDVATGRTIKVVHRVVDAIGNVIHEHIKFP